jgi:hypothetical protein
LPAISFTAGVKFIFSAGHIYSALTLTFLFLSHQGRGKWERRDIRWAYFFVFTLTFYLNLFRLPLPSRERKVVEEGCLLGMFH